jgi:hypothetical protein
MTPSTAHAGNKKKNQHHKTTWKKGQCSPKAPNITQFSRNNNSKNATKSIFNVDLHHNPIRV